MKKQILIVDDSALFRSVLSDVINSDPRFHVTDLATNGVEALDLLKKKKFDAVVLDVHMPKMTGLQLLKEIRMNKIPVKVMMSSTDTVEGAAVTLEALELGALDFIHKPKNALECRNDSFKRKMLHHLAVVADSKPPVFESVHKIVDDHTTTAKVVDLVQKHPVHVPGSSIVAIAISTGGPRALHSVIPHLPARLNAPVVIVQHMPKGFTKSLAERLDQMSEISVKEAEEGDVLQKGQVYIARGGSHLNIKKAFSGRYTVHYTDQPAREGVKPSANYMYESLADSAYDNIVCTVMTGMGADGTEGISYLKQRRQAYVISQDKATSTVYGMPQSVAKAGLSDQVVALSQIAQEIVMQVGLMDIARH